MAKHAVTIIGPNLPDQSKGDFHVHAQGCRDIRRSYGGCSKYDLEVEAAIDVAEFIYEDHLHDEGIEPESEEAIAYFDMCIGEFYFLPCTGNLQTIERA